MAARIRAQNDLGTGRLGEVSSLIALKLGTTPDTDLLQAGNVGADFAQDGSDAAGVIAAIDPDASMNVIGHHAD